jgi:hypothetical protein
MWLTNLFRYLQERSLWPFETFQPGSGCPLQGLHAVFPTNFTLHLFLQGPLGEYYLELKINRATEKIMKLQQHLSNKDLHLHHLQAVSICETVPLKTGTKNTFLRLIS